MGSFLAKPRPRLHSTEVETTSRKAIRLLASSAADDDAIDLELRKQHLSLRVIVREIPPVFGSFY